MCLYNKVLPHCSQLYGFSPVCTIVWSIRYFFHVRTLSQLRFFYNKIKINNTLYQRMTTKCAALYYKTKRKY